MNAINTSPLTPLTPQQLALYTGNLAKIIATVKRQTNAPIILYNLYDPIVLSNNPTLDGLLLGPLHTFAEGNLVAVNRTIANVGKGKGIYVVDAYSTFQANPAKYILPFDIHPTLAGHQALASLADATLQSIIKHERESEKSHQHCHK